MSEILSEVLNSFQLHGFFISNNVPNLFGMAISNNVL